MRLGDTGSPEHTCMSPPLIHFGPIEKFYFLVNDFLFKE